MTQWVITWTRYLSGSVNQRERESQRKTEKQRQTDRQIQIYRQTGKRQRDTESGEGETHKVTAREW